MSVIDIDKLLHDMHMEAFDMEFMNQLIQLDRSRQIAIFCHVLFSISKAVIDYDIQYTDGVCTYMDDKYIISYGICRKYKNKILVMTAIDGLENGVHSVSIQFLTYQINMEEYNIIKEYMLLKYQALGKKYVKKIFSKLFNNV